MVVKTAKLGVTRKALSRKTTPKIPVPKKKAPVTLKPKAQKVSAKKIPILKKVLKKPLSLKVSGTERKGSVVIHDKTKPRVEKRIVVRTPIEPSVPSPYRFPLVPPMRSLMLVSRVIGIFFVTIGTLLSVIQLSNADSFSVTKVRTQEAALLSSEEPGGVESITTTPTQGITTQNTSVKFSVPSDIDTLRGDILVTLTTSEASSVTLLITDGNGGVQSLGNAGKIDATTWVYKFDTTSVPDGTYRFIASVQGTIQSFRAYDTVTRVIANTAATSEVKEEPEDSSVSSTTESDSANTEETDAAGIASSVQEPDNAVSIEVDGDVLTDIATFSIEAPNATEVRVRALNVATGGLYYLGLATHNDASWVLKYDTVKIPNGSYIFTAKAKIGASVYEDKTTRIIVRNVSTEQKVASSTDSSTADETPALTSDLTPDIKLSFSKASPFSNFVEVKVSAPLNTEWVEVYAKRKSSLTPFFLGLAQKRESQTWVFVWQTLQSPNDEYLVYARTKTPYGFVDGIKQTVVVQNVVAQTFTDEEEKSLDTITDTEKLLVEPVEKAEEAVSSQKVYVESVDTLTDTIVVTDDTKVEVEEALNAYKSTLQESLSALALAKRTNDSTAFEEAQKSIENLKNSAITDLSGIVNEKEGADKVTTYLSQMTYALQEITLQNEEMLKKRIGDDVFEDTDKDGISNYDEAHLYHTNPFSADTDNDGYIDSAEIFKGFNPHDSSTEALVQYESPKNAGVVREDILAVASISTLTASGTDAAPKALIQGKALPNSFVTLYIFSDPIVVTIKTDDAGNWSYVFDKELDDGTHEVYAAITDNSGALVAKSRALPFVKTAEAFTTTVEKVTKTSDFEPSFFSKGTMLLVGSFVVIVLGLILMMLAIHTALPGTKREPVLT